MLQTPVEDRRIRRLDEEVINRVAAGEILHGPVNAIKEMLENSLDAGSTQINITVTDGGVKMIQIQDNGHGIKKEDLPLVCERFATSKLREFEDLSSMTTFGFRGEALASISHVAHVTITSMTKDRPCAFRCQYASGKMISDPKATAGLVGTTIHIEDLFYNCLSRRKGLGTSSEEFHKISDMVSRYALANPFVSISLKKMGSKTPAVCTSGSGVVSNNIGALFGADISPDLLHVHYEETTLTTSTGTATFEAEMYATNPNYNSKKNIFVLFINERLVSSTTIKKGLLSVYNEYLPRGTHPFLYVKLKVPPQSVDVNINPTKSEVRMLHEQDIIAALRTRLNDNLLSCGTSRTFNSKAEYLRGEVELTKKRSSLRPSKKIRTDDKSRRLGEFPPFSDASPFLETARAKNKEETFERVEGRLESVNHLVHSFTSQINTGLSDIFSSSVLVGLVDSEFIALQHKTYLYLANLRHLKTLLFYQQILVRFSKLDDIHLGEGLPVRGLLQEYRRHASVEGEGEMETLEDMYVRVFCDETKRDMLSEYFSIEIDEEGILKRLPQIVPGHTPPFDLLPAFIYSLCLDVDWTEELRCIDSLTRVIAEWEKDFGGRSEDEDRFYAGERAEEEEEKVVENVLYPAIKSVLKPTEELIENRSILQIASMEKLYKVFERC
ncbi:hypothetical protein PROFUN_06288 [Planoprotostelium fungivorum]|uniref:DNA mismatch repair protein S5 domain-containing protein n=1 Tax=Planoprotostelium fungivorum TaxID=1890364 RepID=A0A2P6NE88_9EUKA|nr:hypothetical protein PROFUN_06288 [Planoprotostelium fungivorum]